MEFKLIVPWHTPFKQSEWDKMYQTFVISKTVLLVRLNWQCDKIFEPLIFSMIQASSSQA